MTRLRYAVKSDVGRSRSLNEDSYLVRDNIFAVADGMGGHQAGEVASELAIEISSRVLKTGGTIHDRIEQAFSRSNSQVMSRAKRVSGQYGMGTTLSVALISGDELWIGHIGDSRIYLLSKGELRQLTEDHTLVAHMLKQGEIDVEEAVNHPKRNIITKAIGTQPRINPDIFSVKINKGDKVVLCTDGLTNMIDDEEIKSIVDSKNIDEATKELVARANARGGADNVTVIAVEIDSVESHDVPRRPYGRRTIAVLVAAALVFLIFSGVSLGLNRVYFLKDRKGKVAVFRGLPYKVGGYSFYRLKETTKVSIDKLPNYYQDRLDAGIVVGSLKKTRSVLKDIASLESKD